MIIVIDTLSPIEQEKRGKVEKLGNWDVEAITCSAMKEAEDKFVYDSR